VRICTWPLITLVFVFDPKDATMKKADASALLGELWLSHEKSGRSGYNYVIRGTNFSKDHVLVQILTFITTPTGREYQEVVFSKGTNGPDFVVHTDATDCWSVGPENITKPGFPAEIFAVDYGIPWRTNGTDVETGCEVKP